MDQAVITVFSYVFVLTVTVLGALALFIGFILGKKKGIELAIKVPMSVFEQQYLKDGLIIVNEFLEVQFLKYIHAIMVSITSQSLFVIKGFLDTIISENGMHQTLVGYTTLVSVLLSRDLKNLFYRYYSGVDEEGRDTDILNRYISEWFILRIRKLNAEYITAIGENMSQEHAKLVNSRMFIAFEMKLYEKLHLVAENSNIATTEIK